MKFYDVPCLRHHVLQAAYDVIYFGDNSLGLTMIYVMNRHRILIVIGIRFARDFYDINVLIELAR